MKFLKIATDGTQKVIEMEDTLPNLYREIACDTIDIITFTLFNRFFTCVLDDNGKIYGQDTITACFVRQDGRLADVVLGNLLLCHANEEGELTDFLDDERGIIEACTIITRVQKMDDTDYKIAPRVLIIDC